MKKPLILRTMTFSFTLLRFFSHFLGPTEDIPVKVTGNVKNGFTAEFVPIEVGIHMILVEYNGVAVHCWYIEPRNREKSLRLN